MQPHGWRILWALLIRMLYLASEYSQAIRDVQKIVEYEAQ